MNLLAVALAVTTALAGPPETAEALARRADRQYADGFFAEASASYAAAYELEPNAEYLYGWAQSERRAGNCPRALELYRDYAELPLTEAAREAARKNALRCGGTLDGPDGEIEPEPEPAPDPTPEPEPEPVPDPWTRDAPAISLLTTGGAIGLVAVVLGVGSSSERRKATEAEVEADYATHVDRSMRLRTGAIVCATIGAAAIVGGVVRYVLVARKRRSSRITASGVGLQLRF